MVWYGMVWYGMVWYGMDRQYLKVLVIGDSHMSRANLWQVVRVK